MKEAGTVIENLQIALKETEQRLTICNEKRMKAEAELYRREARARLCRRAIVIKIV